MQRKVTSGGSLPNPPIYPLCVVQLGYLPATKPLSAHCKPRLLPRWFFPRRRQAPSALLPAAGAQSTSSPSSRTFPARRGARRTELGIVFSPSPPRFSSLLLRSARRIVGALPIHLGARALREEGVRRGLQTAGGWAGLYLGGEGR